MLSPLALYYPTSQQLEVFAVDDDGAIKVAWKSNNGAWNPPHPLSAASFAQPGALLSGVYYPPGGTLEVFHVGNGAVHVLWKAPHVQDIWQGPSLIAKNLSISAGAHSSAVHYPPGQTLEVFFVGNDGAVNGLWKAPHVQHAWQQPYRLANAADLAPPGVPLIAIYYPPGESLELFVVDKRGALTLLWKDHNSAWKGPLRLTEENFAPAGAPVTAVYYPPGENLEVHVVGNDHRVWVLWKDHNGPWTGHLQPLTDPDAVAPMTPLSSAFYPINEQLEVFLGDPSFFSRLLWKHHNKTWAPCAVPIGARSAVAYVPDAQTSRIAQVTATNDFISCGVRGVDLGANTAHNDNHYVFFGDVPRSGRPGGRLYDAPPFDADAVAQVRNFSPDGISLDLVRRGDGYFAPFTIRKADGSTLLVPEKEQTPTGAFSHDGFAYVFVLVHDKPLHPDWPVPVSYLVRVDNPASGQPYDEVFRWSENKFWQVAPWVVADGSVPGLPSSTGSGVVMLGGGAADGGGGGVHLAWMPLEPGRRPRREEIRYYRGAEAGWSPDADHASATPLWHLLPIYTSISVTFVQQAQRWIALYSKSAPFSRDPQTGRVLGDRPRGPIVARSAAIPIGPWSDEIAVFDPCRDRAFGNFMHWPDLDQLDQADPSGIRGDTGWAYGAFILDPLTEWHPEDRTVTLHYLLSTSRPYQVQHMRSRFRLD